MESQIGSPNGGWRGCPPNVAGPYGPQCDFCGYYDECPYSPYYSGSKKVVLWISRHEPLLAQIATLQEKVGPFDLVKVTETIPNAEYAIQLAQKHKAHIIIPVLPLSIIARLVELARPLGIEVWWAEMEQVKVLDREPTLADYNPASETVVVAAGAHETKSWKIMRFKKFNRIKAVKLEMEEV